MKIKPCYKKHELKIRLQSRLEWIFKSDFAGSFCGINLRINQGLLNFINLLLCCTFVNDNVICVVNE